MFNDSRVRAINSAYAYVRQREHYKAARAYYTGVLVGALCVFLAILAWQNYVG